MTVSKYFADLKNEIAHHPQVITYALIEEVRSAETGGLKARLVFTSGVVLDFREFVTVQRKRIVKLAYSYNCRKGGGLLFRYDSSPHHRHLKNAPHHKHLSNGRVVSCAEPTLRQVLREVESYLD